MPLNRVNWGNYDLVVIDESHNFRNNDVFKDRETRYQRLMNQVIRDGVKTKVLMLSATPVNNRFNDLKNQLALAYEGDSGEPQPQAEDQDRDRGDFPPRPRAFNAWSKLPPEERTRSRDPRRPSTSISSNARLGDNRPVAQAYPDVLRHEGYRRRSHSAESRCRSAMPAHPSTRCARLQRDLRQPVGVEAGASMPRSATYCRAGFGSTKKSTTLRSGRRRQLGRRTASGAFRRSMTVNLLKRLESSVEAFRLTLGRSSGTIAQTLSEDRQFPTAQTPTATSPAIR